MKPPAGSKSASPFAQAALALDSYASELERISNEITNLNIESDNGFERARRLLEKSEGVGKNIGEGMQTLTVSLEDLRQRIENSAQRVTASAVVVEQRHQLTEQLMERLRGLGEMAGKVTVTIDGLRLPKSHVLSEEDKNFISQSIPAFSSQLGVLVDEAYRLKQDAASANMKNLERNSDSLRQTLQSARNHLNLLSKKGEGTPQASLH